MLSNFELLLVTKSTGFSAKRYTKIFTQPIQTLLQHSYNFSLSSREISHTSFKKISLSKSTYFLPAAASRWVGFETLFCTAVSNYSQKLVFRRSKFRTSIDSLTKELVWDSFLYRFPRFHLESGSLINWWAFTFIFSDEHTSSVEFFAAASSFHPSKTNGNHFVAWLRFVLCEEHFASHLSRRVSFNLNLPPYFFYSNRSWGWRENFVVRLG